MEWDEFKKVERAQIDLWTQRLEQANARQIEGHTIIGEVPITLTLWTQAAIITLHENDFSDYQIAGEFQLHRSSIVMVLQEHNRNTSS